MQRKIGYNPGYRVLGQQSALPADEEQRMISRILQTITIVHNWRWFLFSSKVRARTVCSGSLGHYDTIDEQKRIRLSKPMRFQNQAISPISGHSSFA